MNIRLNGKFLWIPILFILLLALGTVSASSTDLNNLSGADSQLILDDLSIGVNSIPDDSIDKRLYDSIKKLEDDSVESDDALSQNILFDSSIDNDLEEKSFSNIQSLIDAAGEGSTIELNGTYRGNESIYINKSLNFMANGDKAIIKCENRDYLFSFDYESSATVKFENIKFISLAPNHSILFADGHNLYFKDCIFENMSVGVDFAYLDVDKCLLINSFIGTDYASGIINNSNFTQNSHVGIGKDGRVDIYNSNFENGQGSAINTYDGVDIINCTFINYTAECGGAIYIDGVAKVIKNCVFINNTANSYGGAIYVDPWGFDLLIENCSFINNSAKLGTAIAWNSSDMAVIKNCIFDNNKETTSDSVNTTLYFFEDNDSKRDFSKLNITADNNFWGFNDVVLEDIFKSKKGESFKLSNYLSLNLKSEGNNSYNIYFSIAAGSQVSKIPDYTLTLKDRRTGAVIVNDLLLKNGKASFECNKTLNMDVIDIVNQGEKSVNKRAALLTAGKLTAYYLSGKTLNIKVADKITKKALSGIKLGLKVFTAKKYKYYYVTTDSNGIAKFKASSLSVGTHKVEISFVDKKYSASKISSSVKIIKAKTIISAPKISVKYKKSNYFKVRVKHMSTKKYIKGLKLKLRVFTGKKYRTYTLKTDNNGLAKFNTKNLKTGLHKVLILSGNSNFEVSKKSSIRIRR
ncbi:MAG: hypothetical protein IJP12_02065 [Methanobrevibacter sp.]|nr:hypothetical protein [Methanobrevibacter sp.]